jgi:hypothetical protein
VARFYRLTLIVVLAGLLGGVPAYALLQRELAGPTGEMMPGLVTMLLAPAAGFPVFLAIALVVVGLTGMKLTAGRGMLLGLLAVIMYDVAASIYVLYLKPNSAFRGVDGFGYLIMRIAYSGPSQFGAALVTGFATWLACRILPDSAGDTRADAAMM